MFDQVYIDTMRNASRIEQIQTRQSCAPECNSNSRTSETNKELNFSKDIVKLLCGSDAGAFSYGEPVQCEYDSGKNTGCVDEEISTRAVLRFKNRDAIRSYLLSLRDKKITEWPADIGCLIPVLEIGDKRTWGAWNIASCPAIVVNAREFITQKGELKINSEIIKHGLKSHLGYEGNIILSSIMDDQSCYAFNPEIYADLINALDVDYYYTPDSATYMFQKKEASFCVCRVLEQTDEISDIGVDSIPLGLIKGSNVDMSNYHMRRLKERGISEYILHAGDFLSRSKRGEKSACRKKGNAIQKEASHFLVHGAGISSVNIFPHASGYITQSHYAYAFEKNDRSDKIKKVCENFRKMEDTMISNYFNTKIYEYGVG
jgi:hypothetical protein